jgi:hypothetical protein
MARQGQTLNPGMMTVPGIYLWQTPTGLEWLLLVAVAVVSWPAYLTDLRRDMHMDVQ